MELAGDPTYEPIFTSRKVTNIFENLSKNKNILETELFEDADGEIILPYYVETFGFYDCAVCYFANMLRKNLYAPYIRVYSKDKIHFGCRTEFPLPRFNRKTFSDIPQRYIWSVNDEIHFVFNLLSIKKELRTIAICDFLSCFDDFSFHVEGNRIVDFVGRYLGEYKRKK